MGVRRTSIQASRGRLVPFPGSASASAARSRGRFNKPGSRPNATEMRFMSTTPTARSQKMRMLVALSAALAATAIYAAYPTWQPDTFYKAGTIVLYQGRDYQALVDQTDYSGTGWTPTTTSLW